jgi:hypothetical protein
MVASFSNRNMSSSSNRGDIMAFKVKQDTYYRFGWVFMAFVAVAVFFVLSRELTALLAAFQGGSLGIRQYLGMGMLGAALLGMLAKNKRGFSFFLFLAAFGIGTYLLLWYGSSFAAISAAIVSGQAVQTILRYIAIPAQTIAILYVFVLPGLAWGLTLLGLSGHGASKFTKFLITILTIVSVGFSVLLMWKDPAITPARSILSLSMVPWFFVLARGTYGENYEPAKTTAVATRDTRSDRGHPDDRRDDRRYDDRRDDRRYDDRRDDRRYDDRRNDDRRYDDRRNDDRRYDDRRNDDRRYDERGYDDRRYDDRRYDDRRDPVDDRRLPANVRTKEKSAGTGSEFTGSAFGLLGVNFVAFLVTILTLFFGLPAMVCYKQRWMARHTIVDNRHLTFDGTAGQLFGKWIGWLILMVLTAGIYLFFIPMRMQKWVISHTHLK